VRDQLLLTLKGRRLIGFSQKVDMKPTTVDFLQSNLMSFTPGFSQVKRAQGRTGKPFLNGFRFSPTFRSPGCE